MADNNILIDPRFAKPKNLVGLEDPEEGVNSGSDGTIATGGSGDGATGPNAGGGGSTTNPNNPGSKPGSGIPAPTFVLSSQELVLDSFQNYRVNAILTVTNAIDGATYEIRMSES